MARTQGELTERDRFWLGHLKAIEAEGIATKAYAKRKRLSVQALYQAKKRLVGRGSWPVRAAPRFTPVQVAAVPVRAVTGCRLRLPGGAVLEWDTPPEPAVLASVLERVTAPR
jgi:hypothetical protein